MSVISNNPVNNRVFFTSLSKPAKIALIVAIALAVIGAIAASVIFTPLGGLLFSLAVWQFSLILAGSGAFIIALSAALGAKILLAKNLEAVEPELDTSLPLSGRVTLEESETENSPFLVVESQDQVMDRRLENYASHEDQIFKDVSRGLKLRIKLGNSPASPPIETSQVKARVKSLHDQMVEQFRALGKKTPQEDALKVLSFCHQGAFTQDLTCMRSIVDGYSIMPLPRLSPQEKLPRDMAIDISLDELGNCGIHLRKEQPTRGEPENETLPDKYFQISYRAYIPNIFAHQPVLHRTITVIEPEDQSPVKE